ncbi:hypothetical protein M408DRAFT_197676 [Serendipita vermifera MAFF 305830]|uniref:Uncharacterized protein n=1 Tax=Serendipita vermifera MAFF 305830 TaxID=933852 RepID=A0A0C2VZB3_SERVB|nr:hypothetical protein M408DRAFT_197676 [Serendipita vermifera MAFF 305830]
MSSNSQTPKYTSYDSISQSSTSSPAGRAIGAGPELVGAVGEAGATEVCLCSDSYSAKATSTI